jgi:hypothetical protein
MHKTQNRYPRIVRPEIAQAENLIRQAVDDYVKKKIDEPTMRSKVQEQVDLIHGLSKAGTHS